MRVPIFMFVLYGSFALYVTVQAEETALPSELATKLTADIERLTKEIENAPREVRFYSARGDAHFFLGNFAAALSDYERMVELSPSLDRSHWRRGIAYFYNGKHEAAAEQFTRYHSYDNIDRENGIWRYLCQFKSSGADAARDELLKYEKDDREPFGDLYQLFAGQKTAKEILQRIESAQIDAIEREKRMFYASLYLGLHESVHNRPKSALKFLKQAARNTWAPQAGYGPAYMWHVARLHASQLEETSAAD